MCVLVFEEHTFEDTTCREANGHCLAAKEMKCSQDSDCDPSKMRMYTNYK